MAASSDNFYRSVFDNLNDGVYFVDVNRRITYWNKGAERLTGYSAAEVIGSCCADNLLRHITEEGQGLCAAECPLAQSIRTEIRVMRKCTFIIKTDTESRSW